MRQAAQSPAFKERLFREALETSKKLYERDIEEEAKEAAYGPVDCWERR